MHAHTVIPDTGEHGDRAICTVACVDATSEAICTDACVSTTGEADRSGYRYGYRYVRAELPILTLLR
eukprot:6287973-Prymnesium_polylepis.1